MVVGLVVLVIIDISLQQKPSNNISLEICHDFFSRTTLEPSEEQKQQSKKRRLFLAPKVSLRDVQVLGDEIFRRIELSKATLVLAMSES